MNGDSLAALCDRLRAAKGMAHKEDIALAYRGLAALGGPCDIGDDCAAIPDGDGYLLFAIEGLLDEFVRLEPWFAGYCAVMVNLSDVAAMGGRAIAVVDALWTASHARGEAIWAGLRDAANAYGIPIVGGHTNARSDGDRLAVAVLGRATRLLTSFGARPGDVVLAAIDLRGAYVEPHPYWNCSTNAPHERLRADLDVMPGLSNDGLAHAAKDISMGGVLGTLLMLLECSGVGASIDLESIPRPADAELERWLGSFPSFGFLLSAPRESVAEIRRRFHARDIACEAIGSCTHERALDVSRGAERDRFWDLAMRPFTGAPAGGNTIRGALHAMA